MFIRMQQICKLQILLVGLRGIGVETAKNLVMTGVKSLTLYDSELVQQSDFASNFCVREKDIGKCRSVVVADFLNKLNSFVHVESMLGVLSVNLLCKFHVVIFTTNDVLTREDYIHYNEFCRTQTPPIGFILAESKGLTGYSFVDFGSTHEVIDPSTTAEAQADIYSVVKIENNAQKNISTVYIEEFPLFAFQPNEWVYFKNVNEANELFQVKDAITPTRFSIKNPHNATLSTQGRLSVVNKHYAPKTIQHKSLRENFISPKLEIGSNDESTLRCEEAEHLFHIHLAFQALYSYRQQFNGYPEANHDEQVSKVYELAIEFHTQNKIALGKLKQNHFNGEVKKELLEKIFRCAGTEFLPISAILGGFIAQEALKFIGKFTPQSQCVYLDQLNLLCNTNIDRSKCFSSTNRSENLAMLFGEELALRLEKLSIFIVGGGSLANEHLKNLACLNIGPKKSFITDSKKVKYPDLHRQILQSIHSVGSAKCAGLKAGVKSINVDYNLKLYEIDLRTDTEDVFDEKIWNNVDIVLSGVDNIETRKYIDNQCMLFEKSWIDCGVEDTKGSVQVICSNQSERYTDKSDSYSYKDLLDSDIDNQDLDSPYKFEHFVQWAKLWFNYIFSDLIQDFAGICSGKYTGFAGLKSYCNSFSQYVFLSDLLDLINTKRESTYEYCVEYSKLLFQQMFVNVKGGSNNAPIIFDVNNPTHLTILLIIANLAASALEIPDIPGLEKRQKIVYQTASQKLTPSIVVDEKNAGSIWEKIKDLSVTLKQNHWQPIRFDLEDDSHVLFVQMCCMLRYEMFANNATVDEGYFDFFKCRLYCGDYQPAIITSASIASGYAMIELIQLVVDAAYTHNHFFNSASCQVVSSQVQMAQHFSSSNEKKFLPENQTTWHKTILTHEETPTLQHFLTYLKERYKVQVLNFYVKGKKLYSSSSSSSRQKLTKSIYEICHMSFRKTSFPTRSFVLLTVTCQNRLNQDVIIPPILFYHHNGRQKYSQSKETPN